MSWSWKVSHYSPVGDLIAEFTPNSFPTIASIDRVIVRGNGDCVEASFRAVPAQVNISLRDLIEITIEDLVAGTGEVPIFYGVVVKTGSSYSQDLQEYRVAGFSKRVSEIPPQFFLQPNPFPVLSQDVAEAAKTAFNFIESGLVWWDDDSAPLQGFHIGPITANQAPAGEVLDELSKRAPGFTASGGGYTYAGHFFGDGEYVPPTEWGVRATREIFFQRPLVKMVLYEGEEVTNAIFHERASEEFYTMAAAIVPAEEGDAPYALIYEDDDLVAQYGRSIKRFSVDSLFITQEGADAIIDPPGLTNTALEKSSDNGATWTAASTEEANAILQDRIGNTQIRYRKTSASPTTSVLRSVGVGFSWTDPQFIMEVVAYPKYARYQPSNITVPGADYQQYTVTVFARILIAGNWVWEPIADISTGEETRVIINQLARGIKVGYKDSIQDSSSHEYWLAELHVKPLDLDVVERIARSYFKRLPEDKVELQCYDQYIAPAPFCEFITLDENSIEMPVTEIRYSITTTGGVMTTITLGQAYDPDDVAEQELIKKNIELAQIQVTDWAINNT